MESKNQILTELQEIAPLLANEGLFRIPYTLPAGYFEGFPGILMNRIHIKDDSFQEPETGLEIAEISPLLAGLQKKETYRVPQGFFESMKIDIPAADTSPVKLVSMASPETQQISRSGQKRTISLPVRMLRYAAAACIVAVIGMTVFNLSNNRNITDPIKSLNSVSDQDMANYLDADDIHWTPGIASPSETASVEFNDNDIHELLSSVSDDELEQYFPELPGQKRTVN
jgi:hypothetical protein